MTNKKENCLGAPAQEEASQGGGLTDRVYNSEDRDEVLVEVWECATPDGKIIEKERYP